VFPSVVFSADGSLLANSASALNHARISRSKLSSEMGGTHVAFAHPPASREAAVTHRAHSGAALRPRRIPAGGRRWQNRAEPGTAATAASSAATNATRSGRRMSPPGGRVSYTSVSQYEGWDCVRSTRGAGGGALAGAGGAGGPDARRVCRRDQCSAARTASCATAYGSSRARKERMPVSSRTSYRDWSRARCETGGREGEGARSGGGRDRAQAGGALRGRADPTRRKHVARVLFPLGGAEDDGRRARDAPPRRLRRRG
jgi:hypothetical protein